MIVIDQSKLQEVISAYKKYFPTHIGDEIYKWKAVKQFQDKWNIDAPDFIQMFLGATALFDNLFTSVNHFPRGMVKGMYESEPETVRHMFRELYDESQPLAERVNHFRAEADRIRELHWPDKMHYQDFNAISTYLWARYPDKYYIYKYSEVRATTRVLKSSFVVRKGADTDRLLQAFDFFNLIRDAVQKDPDIRPMLNSVLTSDCYRDENLNCVVVDIDFFVSRFYQECQPAAPVEAKDTKCWMYSPGDNARKWKECVKEGIMCIGWDITDRDTAAIDFLPSMKTDITLHKGDRTLIIDTKYYGRMMQEQFDKQTIHSGNLYQIFTYVKNLDSGNTGNVSGMLLYARTQEEIAPDLDAHFGVNRIMVRTLDLNQDFAGIIEQLDSIVLILN